MILIAVPLLRVMQAFGDVAAVAAGSAAFAGSAAASSVAATGASGARLASTLPTSSFTAVFAAANRSPTLVSSCWKCVSTNMRAATSCARSGCQRLAGTGGDLACVDLRKQRVRFLAHALSVGRRDRSPRRSGGRGRGLVCHLKNSAGLISLRYVKLSEPI